MNDRIEQISRLNRGSNRKAQRSQDLSFKTKSRPLTFELDPEDPRDRLSFEVQTSCPHCGNRFVLVGTSQLDADSLEEEPVEDGGGIGRPPEEVLE